MALSISMDGLSKTLGAVQRPKGRQLNWYVFLFILKRSRLQCWGALKKPSLTSTLAIQLFCLKRACSPSILKCSDFTNFSDVLDL